MNNLSLDGKFVSLVPSSDSKKNKNYKKVESKFEDSKTTHLEAEIKLKINNSIIGYIYSYNYNQIDGYEYIDVYVEDNNKEYIEETINIFLNYIFICFPLRKIYYKGYQQNKVIIETLKKIGFELEANLKENTFIQGKFCDLYILAIYREKFSLKD